MNVEVVESLGSRAWPAREAVEEGGWHMRFSDGYTRRANSATPVNGAGDTALENIRACEAAYRKRGLPPIFRLTDLEDLPRLDDRLGEAGYRREAPTLVMARPLDNGPYAPLTGNGEGGGKGGAPTPGRQLPGVVEAGLDEWLGHYSRFTSASNESRASHGEILSRIETGMLPLVLSLENRVVACGLAVLEQGYAGFFDLVVDPACRGRGVGEGLLSGMLARAAADGAAVAYLQVMEENHAAGKLYRRAGFRPLYRYWYRVPAVTEP